MEFDTSLVLILPLVAMGIVQRFMRA